MDPHLLSAYRATCYRILLEPTPIDLRIGEANAAFDAWLAGIGAATAVFLTAWNPRSQRLPLADNRQRQQALLGDLQQRGHRYWPAQGLPDAPDWTPEDSFVITSLPLTEATALAESFEQNAYLWLVAGQAAQLVVTRLMPR